MLTEPTTCTESHAVNGWPGLSFARVRVRSPGPSLPKNPALNGASLTSSNLKKKRRDASLPVIRSKRQIAKDELKANRKRANEEFNERARILNEQGSVYGARKKYGPSRRAAPVVVKSLETGETVEMRDPRSFAPKKANSPHLDSLARARGYRSYEDYLKSPHWLSVRERKRSSVGYRCELCPSRDRLHVHHDTYARLGAERMSDLKVLCQRCHKRIHNK